MSSVLFLSHDEQERSTVEAVLTAAGFDATAADAANYRVTEQVFDCVVVGTGEKSHELVYHLRWAGNGCVIGIYTTEQEHLDQLNLGAVLCIPAVVDIATTLKGGSHSIERAISLSQLSMHSIGLSAESMRLRAFVQDLVLGFKNPSE